MAFQRRARPRLLLPRPASRLPDCDPRIAQEHRLQVAATTPFPPGPGTGTGQPSREPGAALYRACALCRPCLRLRPIERARASPSQAGIQPLYQDPQALGRAEQRPRAPTDGHVHTPVFCSSLPAGSACPPFPKALTSAAIRPRVNSAATTTRRRQAVRGANRVTGLSRSYFRA